MAAREQRLVFGEVADQYQRFRPTYPAELFDTIAALAGLHEGDRVLDVGAGTGKLTEALVARGLRVTAVEPSAEMAAVLQSRLPDVDLSICGFEEWPVEPGAFGAITAGQSWHWVDADVSAAKAADALRPGGWIALCWNRSDLDGCRWHDDLQPIYQRIVPELAHANLFPLQVDGTEVNIKKLLRSGRFGPSTVRHFPWTARYRAADYTALLATQSNHRVVSEAQRAELYAAIAESIDARGGEIEHPYVTDLVAAPVSH